MSQVDLPSSSSDQSGQLEALFAEELGLVIEVASSREEEVLDAYRTAGLNIESIGEVTTSGRIEIAVSGKSCISGALVWVKKITEGNETTKHRIQILCVMRIWLLSEMFNDMTHKGFIIKHEGQHE